MITKVINGESISEFVLANVDLGAEIVITGDIDPIDMTTLGELTFEDIDNIRYIKYEEGSNHCVVVF